MPPCLFRAPTVTFFKLPTRLDVEVLRRPTGILKITAFSETRKTSASVSDAVETLIPETLAGHACETKSVSRAYPIGP